MLLSKQQNFTIHYQVHDWNALQLYTFYKMVDSKTDVKTILKYTVNIFATS